MTVVLRSTEITIFKLNSSWGSWLYWMQYYWKPNIEGIRYCTPFCDTKNNLLTANVGSPRRVLTAIPLPRPIKIRACLNFCQCSDYDMLEPRWVWHNLNQRFEIIIVHSTRNFNMFKWIMVVKMFIWFYHMQVLSDSPLIH